MVLLEFCKRLILRLISGLKKEYSLAKLSLLYADCKFYPGCVVGDSEFGQYNVLFDNVFVQSSKFGSHTYVQKNSTIFNAVLGKFCSIGSNVSIGPGIHPVDKVTTHPALYSASSPLQRVFSRNDVYQTSKRTTIGNDVWIGERAIILDGLIIGDGAVIAAGSVVTKNVKPYSIVGGVPAKFIRMRVSDEQAAKISAIKWWDWTESAISESQDHFLNTESFIERFRIR